jgi:uncharacterized membrane protein
MARQSAAAWAVRLGLLSLVAIVLALLALTDISHGEADLTLEWNMLRLSFVVIIAFHVVALRALRQAAGAPLAAGGNDGANRDVRRPQL